MMTRRLRSFELLRGLGIVGVVFLHSSLYHYSNLLSIDFDNPPPIVTAIGILLMWAGLFAIVSSGVRTYRTVARLRTCEPRGQVLRGELGNAVVLMIAAYVYFLFLGPAILDRVHGNHDYSVLMGLLVKGQVALPSLERVLYIDALAMLALNVALVGVTLSFLLANGGVEKIRRTTIWLASLGTVFVVASWVRIPLYPAVEAAIARRDMLVALPLDLLVNKNNPILPYLGFGYFGALLGYRLAMAGALPDGKARWRRVRDPLLLLAAIWLVAGAVGYVTLPDTMLQRSVDPMWFFIIVAQVGLFLLMALGALRWLDMGPKGEAPAGRAGWLKPIERFGALSLTVFMFESPLAQLTDKVVTAVRPGWNQTMESTLLFGASMVVLWGLALWAWERKHYAMSVERLVARAVSLFGKVSTKTEALEAPTAEG